MPTASCADGTCSSWNPGTTCSRGRPPRPAASGARGAPSAAGAGGTEFYKQPPKRQRLGLLLGRTRRSAGVTKRAGRAATPTPRASRGGSSRAPPGTRAHGPGTHLLEAEGHGEHAHAHDAVHDVHDQPPVGGGGRRHSAGSGARGPGCEAPGPPRGARPGQARAAARRRRPGGRAAGAVSLQTPPGPAAAS